MSAPDLNWEMMSLTKPNWYSLKHIDLRMRTEEHILSLSEFKPGEGDSFVLRAYANAQLR